MGPVVSGQSKAVFLSYASEDSEAAHRIADALKAGGIEAWFDQSELRGGDAWDQTIRQRIRECRLFVPLISANTEARPEGYFRLEWRLAVERMRLQSGKVAFLVPVVIDDTSERSADVPDAFRVVQWTRVLHGEAPGPFVERISTLLAGGAAAGATTSAAAERGNPASPDAPRRAALWSLAVAAVLAVGAGGGWLALHHFNAPPSTPNVSTGEKSVAVLPFVDLSEKHDQEYFADGMAEEILDLLARVPRLTVIGRTSSFQFKGKNDDLRAIGAKLGAAYMVEGSVRRAGSRIRVTAQLIDARSGAHVWSDSYDRDFGDVLALQNEIARGIARTLELVVTSSSQFPRTKGPSSDAYELYLRGRIAFDRGDIAGFRDARRYFDEALASDPNFLRAAEGLLLAELNIVYASAVPAASGWPEVRVLADRVLKLDRDSVLAHSSLVWYHAYFDYDWKACNHEIDTILSSRTRDPAALYMTSFVAATVGRAADAITLVHEALVLDPLNPDVYQALGGVLAFSHDYDGATRAYRTSLEISPTFAGNHVYIGTKLLLTGQPAAALAEIEAEAPSLGRSAALAETYYALGRHEDSDATLAALERDFGESFPGTIAEVHAFRGERDLAFKWLAKAYANHDLAFQIARWPMWEPLHGDPRWNALMRKLNVPE